MDDVHHGDDILEDLYVRKTTHCELVGRILNTSAAHAPILSLGLAFLCIHLLRPSHTQYATLTALARCCAWHLETPYNRAWYTPATQGAPTAIVSIIVNLLDGISCDNTSVNTGTQ
jgi:hypothetical protein